MSNVEPEQQYTEETSPNEAQPMMTGHTQQIKVGYEIKIASVIALTDQATATDADTAQNIKLSTLHGR